MKKQDVIDFFGTQAAVAEALTSAGYRISQPAVSKWGDVVPEIQARRLSKITGGALVFDEGVYLASASAA